MGTVVVLLLLACGLTAAVRKLIQDKKSGKMVSCGGDCSHCGGACAYRMKQDEYSEGRGSMKAEKEI